MSDRTDREKYLIILDRFYRGRGQSLLTKDESEALDYAISSIKTDLKYDLLYEETTHTADADKKIEPTPNDCETCIHNKGVLECDMYGCKYESTTKNDLAVDCIVDVLGSYTDLDIPYKREIAENILTKLPSVTPQEPILDKIRAEIENINVWAMRYNPDTDKDRKPQIVQKVKEHVIEIIDKYKAGSGE